VKTVSDSRDKVARHLLAYLTVHKWLVGTSLLFLKRTSISPGSRAHQHPKDM